MVEGPDQGSQGSSMVLDDTDSALTRTSVGTLGTNPAWVRYIASVNCCARSHGVTMLVAGMPDSRNRGAATKLHNEFKTKATELKKAQHPGLIAILIHLPLPLQQVQMVTSDDGKIVTDVTSNADSGIICLISECHNCNKGGRLTCTNIVPSEGDNK